MDENNQISFNDFKKLDMRVGKVIEVSKLENADKLYKVIIDFGDFGKKQTITSLVDYYSADDLMDRDVVALVNLAPAKMRGELSECMLLCAEKDDESECVLLKPEKNIAAGTKIT